MRENNSKGLISISAIIGAAMILIIFTAMHGAVFSALASGFSSSNVMTKILLAIFPAAWLFIQLLSILGADEMTKPQKMQQRRRRRVQ